MPSIQADPFISNITISQLVLFFILNHATPYSGAQHMSGRCEAGISTNQRVNECGLDYEYFPRRYNGTAFMLLNGGQDERTKESRTITDTL